MSRTRERSVCRKLLSALVLAALAQRGLIPAGYMPAAGDAGSMQLCPMMNGEVGAAADSATSDHPATPRQRLTVCPFDWSALAAPMPAILVFVPAEPVPSIPSWYERKSRRLPTVLRAQSARAPPALI